MTNATTLMRESGESVAEVADSCREERSTAGTERDRRSSCVDDGRRDERKEADASDTVSPLGREADQFCPPAEDLKGFLSSKKTFKSGEEKAGSIDNIGESRYLAYGRLL